MDRKKIFTFVGLTLLISWTAAGLYYLSGLEWGTLFATAFAVVYMFFPLVCGDKGRETRGRGFDSFIPLSLVQLSLPVFAIIK